MGRENINILFMIIFLICIAESSAIACIKEFHNGGGSQFFVAAVLLYGVVCYLLHRTFYYKDSMGITNVIWSGISVLMVAIVGIFLFHEKVHFHDVVAAGFITAGLLIVKYTK